MIDPFGDPVLTPAGNRNYVMLVSASKDNAKAIQSVLANLKATVDKNATALWIDSRGIGVFITTDLVASDIRSKAFAGVAGDFLDIRDAVVMEIGADWYASNETPMKNWLTAHVGSPLVPPPESRSQRRQGGPK